MIVLALVIALCALGYVGYLLQKARGILPRASHPDVKMVTDLDRMISDPVGFRWKGKVHKIKPMNNETFLRVLNELAKMEKFSRVGSRDTQAVMHIYAGLFATVCDTITLKDVKQMSYAQVITLYREIMACVTGKAYFEGEEKKTPKKE